MWFLRKSKITNFFRLITVSFLVLVSFLGLRAPSTPSVYAQTITNCDVSSLFLIQTNSETTLLSLINTYRQQSNLSPLAWSSALKRPSAWLSNDMSLHNNFNHTDSLGRIPENRIKDCGYAWTNFAENIYTGSNDPQTVFNAWKNSAVHNANMLNSTVKEAGISYINSYWTLDLGSSSSSQIPVATIAPLITPLITPTVTPLVSMTPMSTPTPTPGINTNPTDTIVDVSIQINGVGANGNKFPKHLTRLVTIGVYDQTNKHILNGNGFLKYDGKNLFEGQIHLGQLADDTYIIKVASSYTLVSLVIPEFQNLSSKSLNTLPTVPLTQGDLNSDNVINIDDYNLALPCFQNKNCETKDIIDFNDDGKTDVIDYNLLLSAFHQYVGD